MVGAGGIGCELLKTLALSGFEDIHIVSLFLFRGEDFICILHFEHLSQVRFFLFVHLTFSN